MLPYRWAKTEPIPLTNGRLGQKDRISPYFFFARVEMTVGVKALFFNHANTRKQLKSSPFLESSIFKM